MHDKPYRTSRVECVLSTPSIWALAGVCAFYSFRSYLLGSSLGSELDPVRSVPCPRCSRPAALIFSATRVVHWSSIGWLYC